MTAAVGTNQVLRFVTVVARAAWEWIVLALSPWDDRRATVWPGRRGVSV